MKRGFLFSMAPAVPLLALTLLAIGGCSGDETPTGAAKPAAPGAPAAGTPPPPPAAKKPTPVNEADLPKVPILPGYKYYIGGPQLAPDKYNKYRIQKFNGEVAQPPSRGMVFGVKQEGDKVEYKVWGNGRILGYHRGVMRDGLYWDEYIEGFKNGLVIARENITHDDAAKRSRVVTEDLDTETGEVIRTKEKFLSYLPPKLPEDDEDEDAPDAAAPPGEAPAGKGEAAPAAPAAPAGDAAK